MKHRRHKNNRHTRIKHHIKHNYTLRTLIGGVPGMNHRSTTLHGRRRHHPVVAGQIQTRRRVMHRNASSRGAYKKISPHKKLSPHKNLSPRSTSIAMRIRNLNAMAAILDKNDDLAGDLLIPFVDNYDDRVYDSKSAGESKNGGSGDFEPCIHGRSIYQCPLCKDKSPALTSTYKHPIVPGLGASGAFGGLPFGAPAFVAPPGAFGFGAPAGAFGFGAPAFGAPAFGAPAGAFGFGAPPGAFGIPPKPAAAAAAAAVLDITHDQGSILSHEDKQKFLSKYGSRLVTVHGPCWWHRIDAFDRATLMNMCRAQPTNPACLGTIYASPGRLVALETVSGDLSNSMDLFARAINKYSRITKIHMTNAATGPELTAIMITELTKKVASSERTAIPSNPRFVNPGTHLSFCEFAAILFFTRDENQPKSFSTYSMLRSSMHYPAVKDMTGAQYVDLISQALVTFFFSALYKCPRVRDIRTVGLIPHRSTHLHRFLPVPSAVYEHYNRSTSINSTVAFYCFQSFSLNLSDNSIVPFSQASAVNTHLILLRILINDHTSARYISHYSAVEPEDEVLALPCIPYSISGKAAFANGTDFANFIRDHSGFNYSAIGGSFTGFRGYLIITLTEEQYENSMRAGVNILNG